METKKPKTIEEVIQIKGELSEPMAKMVKDYALEILFEAHEWLDKNRKDHCFCPDCEGKTDVEDMMSCSNQHIKDFYTLIQYWAGRVSEKDFKHAMAIGYKFIDDKWEDD